MGKSNKDRCEWVSKGFWRTIYATSKSDGMVIIADRFGNKMTVCASLPTLHEAIHHALGIEDEKPADDITTGHVNATLGRWTTICHGSKLIAIVTPEADSKTVGSIKEIIGNSGATSGEKTWRLLDRSEWKIIQTVREGDEE